MDSLNEPHLEVEALVATPAETLFGNREQLHDADELVGRRTLHELLERGQPASGDTVYLVLTHHLAHEQLAHRTHQLIEQLSHIIARVRHLVEEVQETGQLAIEEETQRAGDRLAIRHAKDIIHMLLDNLHAAERHQLIEHRLRVAHPAISHAGDRHGRLGAESHPLLGGDMHEMLCDHIGGDGA